VAKTTDVDGMLDSMTHRQFDEWCAKDHIEPIGTPQGLADILTKLGTMIAAIMGQTVKDSYFMPWVIDQPPEPLNRSESAAAITVALQFAAGNK
jgi:hypothetical protein